MSLAKEFKEFAMKGSVVDLAIGVIIGAAFGKIVSSLVEDIIMPPLGKVIGGVNFTDLAVSLGPDPAGKEVLWKYGNFLQISFQFLIVAFVLFMVIRTVNKLKKPDPAAPPPPPPRQEVLLQRNPRPAREEVVGYTNRRWPPFVTSGCSGRRPSSFCCFGARLAVALRAVTDYHARAAAVRSGARSWSRSRPASSCSGAHARRSEFPPLAAVIVGISAGVFAPQGAADR